MLCCCVLALPLVMVVTLFGCLATLISGVRLMGKASELCVLFSAAAAASSEYLYMGMGRPILPFCSCWYSSLFVFVAAAG